MKDPEQALSLLRAVGSWRGLYLGPGGEEGRVSVTKAAAAFFLVLQNIRLHLHLKLAISNIIPHVEKAILTSLSLFTFITIAPQNNPAERVLCGIRASIKIKMLPEIRGTH